MSINNNIFDQQSPFSFNQEQNQNYNNDAIKMNFNLLTNDAQQPPGFEDMSSQFMFANTTMPSQEPYNMNTVDQFQQNYAVKSLETLPSQYYNNASMSQNDSSTVMLLQRQPVTTSSNNIQKKKFSLSTQPVEHPNIPISPPNNGNQNSQTSYLGNNQMTLQNTNSQLIKSRLSISTDNQFSRQSSTQSISTQNNQVYYQQQCPLSSQQLQALNQNLISQGCSSKSRQIQQQVEDLYRARCIQQIDTAIQQNMFSMRQLTEDKYGNYLMQLLIKYCSLPIFQQLLEALQLDIEYLSFNQFSCRVIQLAVERCKEYNIPQFVYQVYLCLTKNSILTLKSSNSQFASHILLVCLQQMSMTSYIPYINQVGTQFQQIACDQYGCRILECIYKYINEDEQFQATATIFQQLERNCVSLANDMFGNYLIQAALRNQYYKKYQLTNTIQNKLLQSFAKLSSCKYGSNICECLIQVTDYQFLVKLTKTLAYKQLTNDLVNDQFGNFIVQMIIQKFSQYINMCECSVCLKQNTANTFGDQNLEISEELDMSPCNKQIVQKETQTCRGDVFKQFSMMVKGILQDIPNNHVQRSLQKFLNYDQLKEIEEREYVQFLNQVEQEKKVNDIEIEIK